MLDTLSFYQKHPILLKRDRTNVPASRVSTQLKQFLNGDTKVKPDSEAIKFYLMNHAVAEVQSRIHPKVSLGAYENIVQVYLQNQANSVARMFYYLFIICTRESRHVHDQNNFWDKFGAKFGPIVLQWFKSLQGKGSSGVYTKLKASPPDIPMGIYTEALVFIFYKGAFSGGYGGPAWGKVADVLKAFTHGEISGEAMMDTGFTLAHNNGPIFNKGMLYEQYSGDLITILDIQRSGQIPQLVADAEKNIHYVHEELIDSSARYHYHEFKKLLGDKFGGNVDWWMVEALGSVGSYPHHKKVQEMNYGKPESIKLIEKKAKALQAAAAAIAAEEAKKWFYVMPNQKVKKLARTELAA